MNVAARPERVVLPDVQPWVWPWLRDWQRDGIPRAIAARDFHLHWACGSGKTVAAILWAFGERQAVLTVTRAVVREQWVDEIREVAVADVQPHVIYPQSERRPGDQPLAEYLGACLRFSRRPWVIVAWNGLRDHADEIREYLDWLQAHGAAGQKRPAVIFDEAHWAKDFRRWKRVEYTTRADAESARALWLKGLDPDDPMAAPQSRVGLPEPGRARPQDAVWAVSYPKDTIAARAAHLARQAERRLALTATETPDKPQDLWAQLDVVEPEAVGFSPWPWLRKFAGAHEDAQGYGWAFRKPPAHISAELCEWLSRRRTRVTDEQLQVGLPPFQRKLTRIPARSLFVRGDKATRAAVKEAERTARGTAEGTARGNEGSMNAQEALLKAKLEQAASRKIPFATSHLHDLLVDGQKILFLTTVKEHANRTYDKLTKRLGQKRDTQTGALITDRVWLAHGEHSPRDRYRVKTEYMAAEGAACILGTVQAWGEGLSLQSTDRIVVLTLPWTFGLIKQLEGRGRRLGQLRALTVEYLWAEGTHDERVFVRVFVKLDSLAPLLHTGMVTKLRDDLRGGSADDLIAAMFARDLAA